MTSKRRQRAVYYVVCRFCEREEARVLAPRYDFVPPDHTTLFITNLGGSSPSYMYRLMSELYDPKDYNL
ncbi:hypothetical protein O3G_MSEX014117 [Manduca sexta]|uniref:Uncharacterized protein n=1 Tax=Manduca sexta TaxID=7130 RepID=A0A922CZL3_MANSE|nr:hypothetical protein O3G_MSEX014117 [Manduca sexta]